MRNLVVLAITSILLAFAAACSTTNNTTANTAISANHAVANTSVANSNVISSSPANNTIASKTDEDAPAAVKAVFPDAQSFVKQHKDIPANAIADIEKDTNAKVPDTDHHSYLAFTTAGGARKQIGAATVVKAAGKDVIVVYDSKNGMPVIREVRAETVPAAFLAQFAGKGHDDKFQVGADLKANGADDATAKAIAQAVRVDALTMQTLYGAAHSH